MNFESISKLLNKEEEHLKERLEFWKKKYKNDWAYLDVINYEQRIYELDKIRAILFEYSKNGTATILKC